MHQVPFLYCQGILPFYHPCLVHLWSSHHHIRDHTRFYPKQVCCCRYPRCLKRSAYQIGANDSWDMIFCFKWFIARRNRLKQNTMAQLSFVLQICQLRNFVTNSELQWDFNKLRLKLLRCLAVADHWQWTQMGFQQTTFKIIAVPSGGRPLTVNSNGISTNYVQNYCGA